MPDSETQEPGAAGVGADTMQRGLLARRQFGHLGDSVCACVRECGVFCACVSGLV